MKKTMLLFVAVVCACITGTSQTLVWSDEFNGTVLDLSKWSYETGAGINGDWGTGQLDAATDRPENVSIKTGIAGADGNVLAITTRKESYTIPGKRGGKRNYTSGRINTSGKASWGPGHKIAARVWAKDVRYQGQGFAFWMMPAEIPAGHTSLMWPQGGEIDIMEYVGSIPYSNLGSVHYAQQWLNNTWDAGNHRHLGAYYSYKDQQVPEPTPQWISVDLGAVNTINRVVLKWETAYGKSYQIQVSNDGIFWNTISSTTTGDGGTDDIALSGSGRYVRVYATERGTQWGYSLYEFEVYRAGSSNLAMNRPAFSSSNENSTLGPEKAVDGIITSRWASGSPDSPAGGWPAPLNDPYAGSYSFHTFAIDWHTDRMEFSVDDIVYHIHYFNDGGAFTTDGQDQKAVSVINGKRVAESEYSNHFAEWHPFEHKMYAILSAGVGGNGTYGGAIVPEAQFPCTVYIDWVRVYSNGSQARMISENSVQKSAEMIQTYPNPVDHTLYFEGVLDGTTVGVIDLTGKSVLQSAIKNSALDVSSLNKGLYIIHVRAGQRVSKIKVIKK